jgi:hypothetical protein
MTTMTFTYFKTHFSEVVKTVNDGETIAVTYGRKKEIIGHFVKELPRRPERKLGILEGEATAIFGPDWKMTEEEILGL